MQDEFTVIWYNRILLETSTPKVRIQSHTCIEITQKFSLNDANKTEHKLWQKKT